MSDKVRICFSPANPISLSFAISTYVSKLRNNLLDVTARFQSWLSTVNRGGGGGVGGGNQDEAASTRKTYSFVPVEEVIGRDADKERLIYMLQDLDLSVIAICGVAGLGKTTLAQFVFHDKDILSYFDFRIWVSVSDLSDFQSISNRILESIGYPPGSADVTKLIQSLDTELFLLVLDDLSVDSYEEWILLYSVLMKGSRGSKVLVTTRSEHVVNIIGATKCDLQPLSYESCLSLFERLAFEPGQASTMEDIVSLGRIIVRKCQSNPLIVRLVANLLYRKGKDKWLQFCDNSLDIMTFFGHDKKDGLFKVLKPSYNELSYLLKACFIYCSLFPKGYAFSKHNLIHLWMAQGFLDSSTTGKLCSEDLGEDCFLGLLARCFFQDVNHDMLGDVTSFRMHDMVHHLAQNIGGGSVIACSDFSNFDASAIHVSVTCDRNFPRSLPRAPRTRTLVLLRAKLDKSDCRLLISRFKHLRALDVHACGIDMLPSNIGEMIHLRYLDLSRNDALIRLPGSLTNLYYLQTLKLNFCQKLKGLPQNIEKLLMLRCLEIDECTSLTYMPLGLKKLSRLHTLNRFVVCTPDFHNNRSGGLKVLKPLNDLGGKLKIELSGDWTAVVQEAAEANLTEKTKLTDLKIEWRLGGLDDKQAYYYYGALLEGLRPPPNLKVLCIEGYRGKGFPSWARMDKLASYLPNLVIVSMEGCRECKYLPPFGQLEFLRCLTLRHMEEVQHVENTTYDPQHLSARFFPSLKELTLHSFHNLMGWWKEVGDMELIGTLPSFPCLSKLQIWNCPKLSLMPLFPHVEEVDFQNVNQKLLEVSTKKAASTSISPIGSSSSLSSTSIARVQSHEVFSSAWLEDLPDLKRLHIKACLTLTIFPINERRFSSVKQLVIDKCDALTVIRGLEHLTGLEELEVSHCKEFHFGDSIDSERVLWSSLSKLRYLTFRGLPKMTTLPEGLHETKSLKFIWIAACSSFSVLPEWIDKISTLQHLRIEACPMLQQLPEEISLLNHLVKLEIMECPKLLERCREPKGEDWHKIKHISRVLLHKSWRYGLMNDARHKDEYNSISQQSHV